MVPKDGVGKGIDLASMKALPKRKGNEHDLEVQVNAGGASMKALPKRKGNPAHRRAPGPGHRLNESPSQKEGKSRASQPCT